MPPQTNPAALAASLVVPGGSGTAADAAVVQPEIAKFPVELLKFFVKKGVRIVACRGSVTDVETRLRNVVPRGWEEIVPRTTWDSVPGTYLADSASGRRVIVATTAAASGGRKIPEKGVGHDSANLALHEALHGRHRLAGKVLRAKRFRRARDADFGRLTKYLKQDGIAGLEETYAESGARFYQRDPALAADWPALFAFWSGAPIPAAVGGASLLAALGGGEVAESSSGGPAIGTAEMADDGTITLELRAARRGAVGHALVVVRPDDAAYEQVRAQHFPDQGGAGILAAVGAGAKSVLIPPSGRD